MRENMGLFRGRRVDNGEWVEGHLGRDTIIGGEKTWLGCVIREVPKKLFGGSWHEVAPETVGECTGLRDKNGKLIFEGDKLIPFDDDIDKMAVEFHDGTFMLCLYGDRGYRSESGEWEYDGSNYGVIECEPLTSYGDEIVVCGNIHDNPKLLKGEHDD